MDELPQTHAEETARAFASSIKSMIDKYHDGDALLLDEMLEMPLEVSVRSGWRTYGDDSGPPEEYRIVLCTGGPHVEIRGALSETGKVESAFIHYMNWGETGTLFQERSWLRDFAQLFFPD